MQLAIPGVALHEFGVGSRLRPVIDQLSLWGLALIPGLLHPFLLYIYFQRYPASYVFPVLITSLLMISAMAVILGMKWMQDLANQRFSVGLQAQGVAPRWELVQGLTPAG